MNRLNTKETTELRLLPFYIEHKLVLQMLGKEARWKFLLDDHTWQAICRFYDLVLAEVASKGQLATNHLQIVEKLRWSMQAGAELSFFSLCLREWDSWQIQLLRNSELSAPELISLAINHPSELISKESSAVISLEGYEGWMDKTTRGKGLRVAGHQHGTSEALWIFDDDQFCSAVPVCADMAVEREDGVKIENINAGLVNFNNNAVLNQQNVQSEFWRRWWELQNCEQPLDLEIKGGERFVGADIICALLPEHLSLGESSQQLEALLSAVPKWVHGQDKFLKSIAAIVQTWLQDEPWQADALLRKLSQDAKAMLLPCGIFAA